MADEQRRDESSEPTYSDPTAPSYGDSGGSNPTRPLPQTPPPLPLTPPGAQPTNPAGAQQGWGQPQQWGQGQQGQWPQQPGPGYGASGPAPDQWGGQPGHGGGYGAAPQQAWGQGQQGWGQPAQGYGQQGQWAPPGQQAYGGQPQQAWGQNPGQPQPGQQAWGQGQDQPGQQAWGQNQGQPGQWGAPPTKTRQGASKRTLGILAGVLGAIVLLAIIGWAMLGGQQASANCTSTQCELTLVKKGSTVNLKTAKGDKVITQQGVDGDTAKYSVDGTEKSCKRGDSTRVSDLSVTCATVDGDKLVLTVKN